MARAVESEEFSWATKQEYLLLKFFKIITACPVEIVRDCRNIQAKFKKSLTLWTVLVLILTISYICGAVILRIFLIDSSKSDVSFWSEATHFCGFMSACLVILIESYATHECFSEFIMLNGIMENELKIVCCRELYEREKYLFIRNFRRKFVIFQLLTWTAELLNILSIQSDPVWKFCCLTLVLPIIFTRIRCFQHRLCTGILNIYVKLIRMKFGKCTKSIDYKEILAREQNQKRFMLTTTQIRITFNQSMQAYHRIFQMTALVNKMFGYSIFIILLVNFLQLLLNLIWIYWNLYELDLNGLPGMVAFNQFPKLVSKLQIYS